MISFTGNCQLFFTAKINKGEYTLKIAVGTLYRLRVNNDIAAYGPARAPHGYARVDLIPLKLENNSTLELEVIHYETKSFYMPLGPGFLWVEVRDPNGTVILTTDDFSVNKTGHRNFQVEKFTLQRHLLEFYDYTRIFEHKVEHKSAKIPKFLDRGAPLPDLHEILTARRMDEPRFPHFDFGRVVTGFLQCVLAAETACELLLRFDEVNDGDLPGKRIKWGKYWIQLKLDAGQRICFESFEPYTLRYAGIQIISGELSVKSISLREYAFPKKLLHVPPAVSASKIGMAAVETFRQNTIDTFMDCPGRERAAWLCDSFFTARASFLLTGNTALEETFLENFLIPDSFEEIPPGMFPMCYPADTKNFIPQWPMWLVLQIEDYLKRRNGKRDFPHEFKLRFMAFLEFFKPYFNVDGLLENLPSWNFVDCSKANDFVSGVNYPTNLLFAQVLEIISKWYDAPELIKQANAIRDTVYSKGVVNGHLYDNDSLQCASETAQYFALIFGGNRFKTIDFEQADYTDAPCGLLMGKFLRFEILLREKRLAQLKNELEKTFGFMAEQTGTLWEKMVLDSSSCHGFTAYAANLLAAL